MEEEVWNFAKTIALMLLDLEEIRKTQLVSTANEYYDLLKESPPSFRAKRFDDIVKSL